MLLRWLPILPFVFLASCGGGTQTEAARPTMSLSTVQVNAGPIVLPYERGAYLIVASDGGSLVRIASDPGDPGIFVPAASFVRFADTSLLPYVEDGSTGKAYRLYRAAFARTPDIEGLRFWIDALNQGFRLDAIAQGFADSAEFKTLYGADSMNPSTITALYRNVLGRQPDAGGLAFWQGILSSHGATLSQILLEFSESAENKAASGAQLDSGIPFKEAGITYSDATAPQSGLSLDVSGKRYVGGTLALRPNAATAISATATYAWSLMSKPARSKAAVNAATPSLDFVPDVPGNYLIGLTVIDNGKKLTGSVRVTVTEERLPNKPYTAKNSMSVTLESVTITDRGSNYVDYTVTYVQTNNTQLAIEEGMLKLYFQKVEPLAQYGFFNKIYPGETLRRSYVFTQLKGAAPAVLEYDADNFFRTAPALDSLQWPIPLE